MTPNDHDRGAWRLRDAIDAGIGRGTLHGPSWTRISHGLFVPSSAGDGLADRCRQLREVLPAEHVFSHLTAAMLWSVWLPHLPEWLPIHATNAPGRLRPERSGLYVARSRAALPEAWNVDEVPVLAPALVAGQLAEDLALIDLVVALDCLVHRRLCSVRDILDGLRSRQRGLPMLRRALPLVDGRSESPWESALRLLHVLCGIAVEPQFVIRDDDGEIFARADLRIVDTRRLSEYDGAVHRDKTRHERDLGRDKLLARHGYDRYGYTASELLDHPELVISDAEQALGLPHDRRRVEPWLTEFERSSLSPLGYRRLMRRLRRYTKPLRGRGQRRTSANCGEAQGPNGVSA